ncbi:diaminohydroxyphosphoribosylaminopyrimidine deaminase/5-amino-6-(5-phosphoribosylamino)uracil reductase [Rhodococcus sp. SORGH_AS 301]|nr:diaminohydroxyphosphoribosylaminopyrimidine deaminase/5-amino-6-(5-phosphoribosylamino)uracil reductase [Rhodococcus sp. SORGH_AS_0301]
MTGSLDPIDAAMRRAIEASVSARGVSTPNPPVGAVVLDRDGLVVGVGATAAPGGPHAEIAALAQAGERARGGTAVVTLEPCDHTGRTGPCSQALLRAGVVRVVHALGDPNPVAAGGAETLRGAGVEVRSGVLADLAEAGPMRAWLHRQRTGRPMLTWKYAATLDGRTAAPDGTSRWITGEIARAHVHAERARIDAVVVGTGTVLADDPVLTARLPDGSLAAHQPVRVVVGLRDIPAGSQILDDSAPTRIVRTRDPFAVMEALADLTDVVLEGGSTLTGAFLSAGLVDRVTAYLAPVVLGEGPTAVRGTGVGTIADAMRFRRESVETLGDDLLVRLAPLRSSDH